MAQIIDGRAVARQLDEETALGVAQIIARTGRAPGLAVVLVGNDPASEVYVAHKIKACARVGIESHEHRLPAETSQDALLTLIARLNADPTVHGILVQLPLPDHIDERAVINAIDPAKDVDGFHPDNLGRLVLGKPRFVPCTPAGCMRLLQEAGVDPAGKRALVIGRSTIVGKPMAHLLLAANATVTIAHSRTTNLAEEVSRADIVVAAVGRAHLVRGEWIKPGAAVIDVGMNRLDTGKLAGDVDFEGARQRAGAITPVPGGVGPMTIAGLMANVVRSAESRVG